MAPAITQSKRALECPSAQPDMDGARVFGLIGGTVEQPRIQYLKKSAIVTEPLASKLDSIDPTKVFRYAVTCEQSRCQHFSEGQCSLAHRVAQQLPAWLIRHPRVRSETRADGMLNRAFKLACGAGR